MEFAEVLDRERSDHASKPHTHIGRQLPHRHDLHLLLNTGAPSLSLQFLDAERTVRMGAIQAVEVVEQRHRQ